MRPGRDRVCLIGAGYVGIGVARELQRAGIAYDQLEAREEVGGNWRYGVYESTHMITGKRVTEFPEYPMPARYPAFPSHRQMLAYLRDFVDHFGLERSIECGREVVRCEPLDRDGSAGWEVELNGGEVRHYRAVLVANGHHWEPNVPEYPGSFSGQSLHSYAYKRPADLGPAGARVLVVGAGNSACDIAVEASTWSGTADISMRGGYWFLPKTAFGIPVSNMTTLPIPTVVQRPLVRLLVATMVGGAGRYGIPKPDHELFTKDVTVNTTMLSALQHGRVRYRPSIERLDGSTVHFSDGTTGDYDTIVWATGYKTVVPFVGDRILQWENGHPVLIRTVFVPGFANLYVVGAATIRAGGGDLIPRFGALLARILKLQEQLDIPISNLLGYVVPATSSPMLGGAGDLRLVAAVAMPMARALTWTLPRLARLRRGTESAQAWTPADPVPLHLSVPTDEEISA